MFMLILAYPVASGYPRLLLKLVLESDFHRGEILTLFAKTQ